MIHELEFSVDCSRCGAPRSCVITAEIVRPAPVCMGGACPHDHSWGEARPCCSCGHVIDDNQASLLAEAELDAREEGDASYDYIND